MTMTKQEIFNTVVTHLYTQGKPAVNEGGACKYRSHDGLKCAVGCLIPDDMYHQNMESKAVGGLISKAQGLKYTLPECITNPDNRNLLEDLQGLHDGSWEYDDTQTTVYVPFSAAYLRMGFDMIAEKYSLRHYHRDQYRYWTQPK